MSPRARHASRTSFALGAALAVAAAACGKKAPPPESLQADPARAASSPAAGPPSASAAVSASAAGTNTAPVPSGVPQLAFSALPGHEKETFFPIEGALLVAERNRIGRLVPETGTVEPVGKVPAGERGIDALRVYEVGGHWPDTVDVFYAESDGRNVGSMYFPLVGKGIAIKSQTEIGGTGWFYGTAQIRGATLLAKHDVDDGSVIRLVRGKGLPHRLTSRAQAGCVDESPRMTSRGNPYAALELHGMGATPAGTLVAIGKSECVPKGDLVEVWDLSGKTSKQTAIGDLVKDMGSLRMLPTVDDELFVWSPKRTALLRFREGTLAPATPTPVQMNEAFVVGGALHFYGGGTIWRYREGAYEKLGELAWNPDLTSWTKVGETFWASSRGTLGTLVAAPPEASTALTATCANVFVHVSDGAPKNPADFTYPTTRKAIASFAEAADLQLLEITVLGTRRVGVAVKSLAQGEALVKHLGAKLPEEKPKLLCFDPRGARAIPLSAR